ncbi:retinal rod rhodopsin-sensitive cGMP 3,5-cyclic phosphodiesterase subunit delta [Pelomyxa schiedti]|nr:retinal rod rhodopsin-sensitive cGMP 3,5-cyclic phosphodiesterase subunit delta [Pelomyxa schiedti]
MKRPAGTGTPSSGASSPTSTGDAVMTGGVGDNREGGYLTQHGATYGFKLHRMWMSDGTSGEELWNSNTVDMLPLKAVHLPKDILQCKVVSRKLEFSSEKEMHKLHLDQVAYLDGTKVEGSSFAFGYVIPGSTNTWENVVFAAPVMLTAEVMSGHLIMETTFWDEDVLICKSRMLVFYD